MSVLPTDAQSRIEKLLSDLLNENTSDISPQSRNEAFLLGLINKVVPDITPVSRVECYLKALCEKNAVITPDDTTVDGKPWTSKKIVDTICQPFSETGNPVQCYPVENYPLGVKVSWEPVQEGSGDPSPDNIRPITGRDAVQVTRCGKNLLDFSSFANYTNWRMDISTEGDTPTKPGNKGYILPVKPSKTYTISFEFLGDTFPFYLHLVKSTNGVSQRYQYITTATIQNKVVSFTPADNEIWYLQMGSTNNEDLFNAQIEKITYIQLELSSISTPYEPYTGDTYDIALPETVYGGTLDSVTGEGQETWKIIDLANAKLSLYGINQYGITNFSLDTNLNNIHTTSRNGDYFTSSLPEDAALFANATKIGIYKANASTFYIRLKETDAKNEAMAKEYLASINAKLVYKLAEPVPFTATGAQPIPALSGVNTIYTDADGVVVTGAEDPKHTITELKNAIISLGGNV